MVANKVWGPTQSATRKIRRSVRSTSLGMLFQLGSREMRFRYKLSSNIKNGLLVPPNMPLKS